MKWYVVVLICIFLMTNGVENLFMWAIDFCKLESRWGKLNPKPAGEKAKNQSDLYYIIPPKPGSWCHKSLWKMWDFWCPLPFHIAWWLLFPPLWKRAGNFFFGESKPEDLWTWGPQALLWVGFHYRQQLAECFNLTCMLVKHIHRRFWDTPHPHPAFFTYLASRTGSQAFTPKRGLGRH